MICCSIVAHTKEKAIHDMPRSKADIIEIRLDYISELSKGDIDEIISKKPCPLIMTCRKKEEGGQFKGSEGERIGILKKCLKADYVDIEFSAGKEIISELTENKGSSKIIVSYHNFEALPGNIEQIFEEIKATNCDIVKIACMANSLEDNLRMFELIRKAKAEKTDIIGLCMGEKGEISRVLNLAYGSYLTYGYLEKGRQSAPGQLSCEFLKRVYGADKLDLDGLKIYGLVGRPVSKSRGYIVHNLAFKEMELNAVYVNFLVDDLEEFIKNFKGIVAGLSVTMPYKQEIIQYLDKIEPIAKKVGAVNTVSIRDGKLVGHNTDVYGAIEAIEEKIKIEGKNVVIFGAGGAARAIGYGIVEKKGNLIIVNRTAEKGKKLGAELGVEFKSKEKIDWQNIDILINATSVGMMPDINESPIEKEYLHNMVVFDTVYNPPITKMLDMAENNGCTIISGIRMFIYQAAKQFELWTGKQAEGIYGEKGFGVAG